MTVTDPVPVVLPVPASPTAFSTSLLDLDAGIGQRAATFRFDLLDGPTGAFIAELHPLRDSPPTLDHDTGRTIKRTVQGMTLGGEESELVDPERHRLRLSMLVGDGRYPLGLYVFTDRTSARTALVGARVLRYRSFQLVDAGTILDQAIEHTFGVDVGEPIRSAMERLVGSYALAHSIEASGAYAGSPLTWAAGSSGAKIVEDLAPLGGYLAPWFGHDGRLHAIQAFDPSFRPALIDYDLKRGVKVDSIAETEDLLAAPNRFIVVNNSVATTPIVGVYDIPSAAPHSVQNRGFAVPKVLDVQGLVDDNQAAATARAIGLQQTVTERIQFTTSPDPRHDSWDVIRLLGEDWLEFAWSLPLIEGGDMTHQARRAYPQPQGGVGPLPVPLPGITLDPASGVDGDGFTVTGHSFSPNASVSLEWDGTPICSATTDSTGRFVASCSVPSGAPDGAHVVRAVEGGHSASATFAVGSVPPSTATLSLTPTSGHRSDNVAFDGDNWTPGQNVQVRWDDGSLVANASADGVGHISGSFNVPQGAASGSHAVTASQGSTTAQATYTVSVGSNPQFTVTPNQGHGGSMATVNGTGWTPNDNSHLVYWDKPNTPLGSGIITDSSGNFSANVQIPNNTDNGSHTIQVLEANTQQTATQPFTVQAWPDDPLGDHSQGFCEVT